MRLIVTTTRADGEFGNGITYHGIDAFRVGTDGALRLYRRRLWLFLVQHVYHPPGEWVDIRRDLGDGQ
jgi:hypothetical protein